MKAFVVFASCLPLLVNAVSLRRDGPCGEKTFLCCSSLYDYTTRPNIQSILTTFWIGPLDPNIINLVGLSCSGINAESNCMGVRACCANNNFGGIIATGCAAYTG